MNFQPGWPVDSSPGETDYRVHDVSVFENLRFRRFRPSILIRKASVFESLHLGKRLRKPPFSWVKVSIFHCISVDDRRTQISVDGALVTWLTLCLFTVEMQWCTADRKWGLTFQQKLLSKRTFFSLHDEGPSLETLNFAFRTTAVHQPFIFKRSKKKINSPKILKAMHMNCESNIFTIGKCFAKRNIVRVPAFSNMSLAFVCCFF